MALAQLVQDHTRVEVGGGAGTETTYLGSKPCEYGLRYITRYDEADGVAGIP